MMRGGGDKILPNSVAQLLDRSSINYYSIIRGTGPVIEGGGKDIEILPVTLMRFLSVGNSPPLLDRIQI